MATEPPPTSPLPPRQSQPFDLEALGEEWKIHHLPLSADEDSEFVSSTQGMVGEGGRLKYAVYEKEIEKSPNDRRAYKLIRLANGLEALLASDPTADKAASSLSVGVGSLSDPDDLPGLAHFLEHMLFLGTEKYPDEAEFANFLSQHSGSTNAWTDSSETNYYLDVHPTSIPGALARHAQFFTSPLFLLSCTDRELTAVDNEFRGYLTDDGWRAGEVERVTGNLSSRVARFTVGNLETLRDEPRRKGVDTRERVVKWFAEEYSANLMKLAVISTQPVDELAALVVRNFSGVHNSNLPLPRFDDVPLLSEKEVETFISYKTLRDDPQLSIQFQVDDQSPYWKCSPGSFVSHLLGHESKGSIMAYLRDRGWATSLSAWLSNPGRGLQMVEVSIDLTTAGLPHHEDVLSVVFAYIHILQTSGPQQHLFEENVALDRIAWRWQEQGDPGDFVTNASSFLHKSRPRSKLFSSSSMADTFDGEVIERLIGKLVRENCRVFLGTKEPLIGMEWNQAEKHFGVEYSVSPLKPTKTQTVPSLHLPAPNIFVPQDLKLLEKAGAQIAGRPALIRQTTDSQVFYKKDDVWNIPRTKVAIRLKSALLDASPRACILSSLVEGLVEEELATALYDAERASLYYTLNTGSESLTLYLSGYSEKLPVLLGLILDKLRILDIDPVYFASVHNQQLRSYHDVDMMSPMSSATRDLAVLTNETFWSFESLQAELEKVTLQDAVEHGKAMLSKLQIQALVHGNTSKAGALKMLDEVNIKLPHWPADPSENDFHRALLIPTGTFLYRRFCKSDEHINSAITVLYSCCLVTDKTRYAELSLLAQVSNAPIFSTLRTVEQLGYSVYSSVGGGKGVAGLSVAIQGEHPAEYLDERIEAFWKSFSTTLAEMPTEEFETQRQSLIDAILEKPKNLAEENEKYWDEIHCETLEFDYDDRLAEVIAKVTQNDVISFLATFILPSPLRRKLSVLSKSKRLSKKMLLPLRSKLADHLSTSSLETVDRALVDSPTFTALTALIDQELGDDSVPPSIQQALIELSQNPSLPAGTVEIFNAEEFKRTLERAPRPSPANDFSTDLTPHL